MPGRQVHNSVMNIHSFSLLIVCAFVLGGCAAGAVGLGATAGVAASQEGGLKRAVSDAQIQLTINDLWIRSDFELVSRLDLTVNQGRVLITGVVDNPQQRVEAVRLAWQPKGVKQVINEIQVAEENKVFDMARDTWISSRLRAAIAWDRDIQSINYTIDTVRGVVYLMGAAQNQQELDRVIEVARSISGVKRVVSYVRMVGEGIERKDLKPLPPDAVEREDL